MATSQTWSAFQRHLLGVVLLCLCMLPSSLGFQVALHDDDPLRQTCSGMWSGKDTSISLSLEKGSAGSVATIIYEYADFGKIGKPSGERDVFGRPIMAYICTAPLVAARVCDQADVGNFIVNVDPATLNQTSIMRQRIDLGAKDISEVKVIEYPVKAKGYYCVAAVPMTVQDGGQPSHTHFTGRVNFANIFKGHLPASEWPKLQFYMILGLVYVAMAAYWALLCFRHRDDLLRVQHFISLTMALLILGCAAQWSYLNYLNSYPFDFWSISSLDGSAAVTAGARTLLILSSILDAARNSISFFLLLIVAMGYGVVRPSIGPIMKRVRLLTIVHFVCGVLYAVGVVLIITESGGSFIFLAILPLAFTLSAFMTWTLRSLHATIEHLTARKQVFKREMFVKLNRILLAAVVAIFGFFVLSSVLFSQSGGDSFSPRTWPYRWFLLDGWMGGLYCIVFAAIAWIWRPTGRNMMLSMSDEVAQDEDLDADAYEVDEFAHHPGRESDEEAGPGANAPGRGKAQGNGDSASGPGTADGSGPAQPSRGVSDGDVVFEIGDGEDGDDDERDGHKGVPNPKARTSREQGNDEENEGLMIHQDASRETIVPRRGG